MADVQPLRALHYDLAEAGSPADVVAPPYDVIDPSSAGASPGGRPTTSSRRPARGRDPYAEAAGLRALARRGAIVRDDEPALWSLTQDYTGPDGRR